MAYYETEKTEKAKGEDNRLKERRKDNI